MSTVPLPDHPVLRRIAERLEEQRHIAEIWDSHWRVVYMTEDYVLSVGAGRPLVDLGVGEPAYAESTLAIRDGWPAGATNATFVPLLAQLAPAIAHDLPGGVDEFRALSARAVTDLAGDVSPAAPDHVQMFDCDIKFGTGTRPFYIVMVRLLEPDGAFVGTLMLGTPGLPGAILSLLGTGDRATLERTLALLRPARRPGAVMFVDLEGSSRLARSLSTPAYFAQLRRLVFRIDEEVVVRGGVVGKHAGDGASAFFLAEMTGGESIAARECIAAARAIRAGTAEIAVRSGLQATDVAVRSGLHWGATLYVGRLLTGGRTEVTGLGDEVNEAARIEACARGGQILASKALLERVSDDDALDLDLDLGGLRYAPLSELAGATAKAMRDAPSIPVAAL